MSKCCVEAERCFNNKNHFNDMKTFTQPPIATNEAIAAAAVQTVLDLSLDLVLVLTENGSMAQLVSKYRPPVPILACSANQGVIRQLNLIRGVTGY